MAIHLVPLQVEDIKKKTRSAVEVRFAIPEDKQSLFAFQAGQYLTLESTIGGNSVRRSYSLCRAPEEKSWSVAIKKIDEGLFSTFANDELKVGDTLLVMPPQGNFQIREECKSGKHFVFFASGSGITPIFAMIRHILFSHPGVTLTLFYGNKNVESVMFREELEDLKNRYLDRLGIHHFFSREKVGVPILFGRLNAEKCRELSGLLFQPDQTDGYYLCGPESMVFDLQQSLLDLGVAPEKIHFELFNTQGLTQMRKSTEGISGEEAGQQCEVQIQLDGDIIEFSLAYGGDNLLDAAIDHGADLPYSCKGGVCSTCKAKVVSGKVSMDLNYALEPEEVEAGYVLMCQAHPRSEQIFIDFDQK